MMVVENPSRVDYPFNNPVSNELSEYFNNRVF